MKLREVAEALGLEIGGAEGGEVEIHGLDSIATASAGQLTYIAEVRFAARLADTGASAAICRREHAEASPIPCLVSDNPAVDFARATRLFHRRPRVAEGVHPTAVVAGSATLGRGVRVGPFVVVGERVELGEGTEIHAQTVLYDDVRIGAGALVHAGCVLREGTVVGDRCILQPGVVLGSDGFGFARAGDGHYEKIEQMGIVVLEQDVEVGAGSTIDRASFGETRIARGTKIDNLVQVGHNSLVGEDTILCAQVGLAGSTRVGRGVTLAGQVGVAGHCEIGDGAIATAQTGIPNSVEAGKLVSGYPAIENRAWLKSSAVFNRLPDLQKTVRRLEKELAVLTGAATDEKPRSDG